LAEIGLLEEERHTQYALPEIDGTLPGGSDESDVVNALRLCLGHEDLLPRDIYYAAGAEEGQTGVIASPVNPRCTTTGRRTWMRGTAEAEQGENGQTSPARSHRRYGNSPETFHARRQTILTA